MNQLKMKTFSEVLNSMALWIKTNSSKLTNFFVGSVIRCLLEAVASELEALYFQMYKGFKYAIENAIFHSFDFYKVSAAHSTGEVTVVFKDAIPQAYTFEAGFRFCTIPIYGDIVYFSVAKTVVAAKGATAVLLNVTCDSSGEIGNVPAKSIQIVVTPVGIIQSVYNEKAFTDGAEEESSADRKKRFTTYIQTLSRGTTDALRYGCISVAGVAGAYVEDGVGIVKVYVHDNSGNLPDALKALVVQNLKSYKAAGIEVQVLPVTKVPVDITVTVMLADGFSSTAYKATIQASIVTFLNFFPVSKSLTRSELIKYIMTIDENAITNASINLTKDVTVSGSGLIRAGVITVVI